MEPDLESDLGALLTAGIDRIIDYSYGLTPQVLATCQTLLCEGWPLLYTQKTRRMVFVARDNAITNPSQGVVCSFSIGDYVLGQEQRYDQTFNEIDGLLYRAFSHFSNIRLKPMFVGDLGERILLLLFWCWGPGGGAPVSRSCLTSASKTRRLFAFLTRDMLPSSRLQT